MSSESVRPQSSPASWRTRPHLWTVATSIEQGPPPSPSPGSRWRTSMTPPRSPPNAWRFCQQWNELQARPANSRLLRPRFPESSPGESASVCAPRLFAAGAPHPSTRILSSDSPCPMGRAHPPMEGLLPAQPPLDAPLAWLAGLARQWDPLRVASQCLEAQLPLVQCHLRAPIKSRLHNSNNPSPPFTSSLGLYLLPTHPVLRTAPFGSILALRLDHAHPDPPKKIYAMGSPRPLDDFRAAT